MASLTEQIVEETKTLDADQAKEVVEFIGHLKQRPHAAPPTEPVSEEADADWGEFERLAGAWSGKFDRKSCYDRPVLR